MKPCEEFKDVSSLRDSLPIGLAILFFAQSSLATTQAPIQLPPVIATGSAGEVILEDPVVPGFKAKVGPQQLNQQLLHELPLPMTASGRPGSMTGFQGLGSSSEDTSVQTLGIPLNLAQGGGFDFSTFPSYFWSEYRFQLGSDSASLDPGTATGSLSLVPWTLDRLTQPGLAGHLRFVQTLDTLGSFDTAGATSGKNWAVLAGYTSGRVNGPAVSFSSKHRFGNSQVRTHLLGVSRRADVMGSGLDPETLGEQLTVRIIPVIELEVPLGIKSSAYFDGTFLKYDDASETFSSRDHVRHIGLQNAWTMEDWTFGLSGRGVWYRQNGFHPPAEGTLQVSAKRKLRWGDENQFLFQPQIQWVHVSAIGSFPAVSLGVRQDLSSGGAVYARGGASHKFPSLVDRYYSIPGSFEGNPALRPEQDYTFVLGFDDFDLGLGDLSQRVQVFAQAREDALIAIPNDAQVLKVENHGTARAVALMQRLKWRMTKSWSLTESLTWSESRFGDEAYPYLPAWAGTLGLEFFRHRTGGALWLRGASKSVTVPGYGLVDVELNHRLTPNVLVQGLIRNLMNRPVELILGYPLPGRSFSVAFMGEF